MKKSLLDLIEEQKLLTPEQIKEIKFEAANNSKPYEVLIREKNLLDEEKLTQLRAETYSVPYTDLKNVAIPPSLLSKVDVESLKRYVAVPFEVSKDGKVKVAMNNPVDMQAIQALRARLGSEIIVHIASISAINALLGNQSGEAISTQVSAALEDINEVAVQIDEKVQDISQVTNDLKNAPVARIINTILELAVKLGASDVHIEPEEEAVRVRLRLDGVLQEKLRLPKDLRSSLASRVKILSRLKIDEKRVPQDGRFPIRVENRKVDLRVSTIPTVYGEKVVMRLLESTGGVPPLETSGMRGSGYKVYIEAIKKTTGIVLVTGPTGSGKSRTLAGTLSKVNSPGVNIITLEDPVEIRIQGVNQVQMNAEVGLTFAEGLRSVLRQDPDIVMVGEIRDQETARLAVQASLTGHLVFSTLHTNNAAGALPRLLDMGIEPYLIASTVQCVVAQRLTRTICPHCREAYIADPDVIRDIMNVLNWKNFSLVNYLREKAKNKPEQDPNNPTPVPEITAPPETSTEENPQIYLYRGKGCDQCDNTGYSGRTGIFEVMQITEKIAKMIMEHKTSGEINNLAVSEGMLSMIQDGYLKSIEGITTIEEVLRVSKS